MPGRVDEAKGKLKEGAGKLLGNEQMEAEGKVEHANAKAAREVSGAANQVGGAVKSAAGKVLDNEQMQLEGEVQKLKGKAQSAG